MTRIDYRLNALVDASLSDIAALPVLAGAAARHGATLIQYRDKTAPTGKMIEQAREIGAALKGSGIPFVVNDRVDVALAAGADGVHLGADDMDAETARRLLGVNAIIGLTVKNADDAARAARSPADYACIGGVFETVSKVNPDAPVGMEGFAELRRSLRVARPDMPVGAIAGVTLERIDGLVAAGADGVAVISAIFRAGDVAAATVGFRRAIDKALETRR